MNPYYLLLSAAFLTACGGESSTSPNDNLSADSVGTLSSTDVATSSSSVSAEAKSSSSVADGLNGGNASSAGSIAAESELPGDSITDSRDGQTYAVYKNLAQYWIAENMRYDAEPNGCYNDAEDNCTKFGIWYSWDAAQSVCPEGWRLPTAKDWTTLKKLNSSRGMMFLPTDIFATSGFHVRLTGGYFASDDDAKWRGANETAYFWDVANLSGQYAGRASVNTSGITAVDSLDGIYVNMDKSSLLAVRCILENHGTMVDERDGQTYKTIRIGDVTWMAENLNYETDGSVTYSDSATIHTDMKYGRYYNYITAQTACPEGWRLPLASEWAPLYNVIDSLVTFDNISLKSIDGWDESHAGNDDFELGLVPAGECTDYSIIDSGIECAYAGKQGYYWMDGSMKISVNEYSMTMSSADNRTDFFNIRCVKD